MVGASYALEQVPRHEPSGATTSRRRSAESWSDAHDEFHEALVSACASPILLDFRRGLFRRSERYRRLSMPLGEGERDVGAEHRAIAEAVLAADTGLSCRLIAAHLQTTTRIILDSADRLGGVFDEPGEPAASSGGR